MNKTWTYHVSSLIHALVRIQDLSCDAVCEYIYICRIDVSQDNIVNIATGYRLDE